MDMDNTALKATVIQRHIQNSVKHLRWSFMKKKTIFTKRSILDVSLGPKYTSVIRYLSTKYR